MNKFKKLTLPLLLYLLALFTPTSSSLSRLGLVSKNPQESPNLLDLKTKAVIEGPYAEIQYIHTYKNPYDHPLETEFYFPRTENSVFHKFEAVFRNQTIVGQIFEKTKAKEMYQSNVKKGNTVAYSERNVLTPDVMKVQVGNIPANESVEIRFSVIQPLEVIINKFWGFTLPSVLTERYAPSSVDLSQAPNIQNVDLEHSSYQEWKIEIEIKADNPFSYIHNPSHNIKPELSNGSLYKAIWNVTVVPDKNFVVYFRSDSLEHPGIIQATHPSYPEDHVLLINFVPQLNKLDTEQAEEFLSKGEEGLLQLKNLTLKEDEETAKLEFIFVIDRSGSMGGSRIENLKKALTKFLANLPKDSLFNIVSFGSTCSFYQLKSIPVNPKNLQKAIAWIHYINSDMGGTEILPALEQITREPLVPGYPRTVMVLTDGDVANPSAVINHVKKHSDKNRVCSVGIGHGASEHLVKNIAKAGKCTSEFVLDDEDIGEKATYMIKAATSQYLENIEFSIECFNSSKKSVFKEESKQGLLLKDEPFKKWVYLVNISDVDYCDAKIGYYNSLKKENATETLRIEDFKIAEITSVWHKVAYDAQLKEFDLEVKAHDDYYSERDHENKEKLKEKIIELSLRYQILSDYTSFLAVLEENTVDPREGRIQKIIPNLNSADYADSASSAGSANSGHYAYYSSTPAASASANYYYAGGRQNHAFYSMASSTGSQALVAQPHSKPTKFYGAPPTQRYYSMIENIIVIPSIVPTGAPSYDWGDDEEPIEIPKTRRTSQPEFSRDPEEFSERLTKTVGFASLVVGGLFLGYLSFLFKKGSRKSENEDNSKKE